MTRFTTVIDDVVEQMVGMTQELLEYSRGNTQLNVERVLVGTFVAKLEEQFLARLSEQGIQVECSIGCAAWVSVDPQRFLGLLLNLLKNAREAMSTGGVLRFVVREEGDWLLWEIAYSGCGMPPEVLANVFEPFCHARKIWREWSRDVYREIRRLGARGRYRNHQRGGAWDNLRRARAAWTVNRPWRLVLGRSLVGGRGQKARIAPNLAGFNFSERITAVSPGMCHCSPLDLRVRWGSSFDKQPVPTLRKGIPHQCFQKHRTHLGFGYFGASGWVEIWGAPEEIEGLLAYQYWPGTSKADANPRTRQGVCVAPTRFQVIAGVLMPVPEHFLELESAAVIQQVRRG